MSTAMFDARELFVPGSAYDRGEPWFSKVSWIPGCLQPLAVCNLWLSAMPNLVKDAPQTCMYQRGRCNAISVKDDF